MLTSTFYSRWALFLVLLLGSLIVTQVIVDRHDRRLDLTEAELHTLSPETAKILSKIQDKVAITYYASERTPAGLQNLRRDSIDYLKEYERTSGGRVEVRVVDPYRVIEDYVEEKKAARESEEAKEATEPETSEETAADTPESAAADLIAATEKERQELEWTEERKVEFQQQGVPELRGNSVQDGNIGVVNFYSTLEIRYLDREPEFIRVHQSLDGLEYELASRIVKLTAEERPKVAFFLGKPDDVVQLPPNPQLPPEAQPGSMHVYKPLLDQVLAPLYDIVEVSLTVGSLIPPDAKLLIVAEPHLLTERQLYEIDRSVGEGRPMIVFASGVTGSLEQPELGLSALRPTMNRIFEKWGFSMGSDVISSQECGTISVVTNQGPFRMRQQVPFALSPLVSGAGLSQESPLTQGLRALIFPYAASLLPNSLVLEENNLTFTPLATTDDWSWNNALRPTIDRAMVEPPGDPARRQQFVVAAMLEGTFPSRFRAGDPLPLWETNLPDPTDPNAPNGDVGDGGEEDESATEEGAEAPIELIPERSSAPGRVIVIGSADMAKFTALQLYQSSSNNLQFITGLVETVALGQDLVKIRAKNPTPRALEKTTSSERWWASYSNIAGIPLLILALSLGRFSLRRAAARRYELKFLKEEEARA